MKARLIAALLLLLCLPLTAQAYVLGPTSPGKWGDPTPGTGATVTWSLMPTGTDCSTFGYEAGCSITALDEFMPAGYVTALEDAFDAWSAVADLTFIQVPDLGLPSGLEPPGSAGDIRIGGHLFDGPYGVLAHGYYPPNNLSTAAGDIHFDIDELWEIGFAGPGFDIFTVMAHELGHALGLGHTDVPGSLMNPYYSEAIVGPQADDIAGMQYLYGAAEVVPIPGTLALLLVGLGFLRRQQR